MLASFWAVSPIVCAVHIWNRFPRSGVWLNSAINMSRRKSSQTGASPHKGAAKNQRRGQHSGNSIIADPFKSKMNPPYEQYWSKEKVQQGLKRGTLFQGNLTVSALKYDLSFVSNPSGGPGFMLEGMPARNRAFQDDIVVVKILDNEAPPAAQGSLSETTSTDLSTNLPPAITTTTTTHHTPSPSHTTSETSQSQTSPVRAPGTTESQPSPPLQASGPESSQSQAQVLTDSGPSQSQASPVQGTAGHSVPGQQEVEDLGAKMAAMELDSGRPVLRETLVDRLYSKGQREEEEEQIRLELAQEKQRKAKVVYIVEKVHNRACAGVIKAFDVSKGQALLSPGDSRVPRIMVPLKDLPKDLPQQFKKYSSTKFVCRIKSWEVGDLFPTGEILRSLGEAGLVATETEALLIDNEIDYEEFSPEVEACLPPQPWTIPPEEERKRRDFRGECVFTVDPETARDLDDALHIKQISDDVYEVGVHIADVSYFMKPDTALDRVASKRATTTYLVHKAFPMLPRLLCENLCSLNPNEDKLSFSVVWQLTKKGEFISEWVGRSIIRSCCKLSYGDAQNMIDNTWSEEHLPPVTGGFSASQLVESVVAVNQLSNGLRSQRRAKGTLRLDQQKLHYFLDDSSGLPFGCEVYPIRQSNRMIEEFMLLANMTVARRLIDAFPVGAMLRRHPPPRTPVLEDLVQRCAKIGLVLDVSSAASIQQSLDTCKGRGGRAELTDEERMVFVIMCVKTMELARYFGSGVQKGSTAHHYALNVPLYTHFTSPIRRYADVVVHRQLAHALGEGSEFTLSPEEVQQQAIHCNKKKKAAKIAGDMSIDMFFSILLREAGPQTHEAMVINIQSRSFDVVLKGYGLVRTVYCNNLRLKRSELQIAENGVPELLLVWDESVVNDKENALTQVIRVFSKLEVTLSAVPKDIFKNKAVISPSV